MGHVDINKYIREQVRSQDLEGNLLDLPFWNEEEAERLAQVEGITLTEAHWDVVRFLRNYYLDNGRAQSGRVLSAALEQEFKDEGGRRWLYTLFPRGPIVQGSRIAGLPTPPYSADTNFGYVE